jgi:lysophospholipase L1-like esterase
LNVAKELLHVAIKSGTVDADGLIELGQIAERAKGSVVTITDGINDVLQIATEKLDNQGSILDKPTEG